MRYQQDLQVKLRQRFRKMMTASYGSASYEVRQVVEWIANQPALRDHAEVRLTDAVRDAAVPGLVRSLDAIHIASAEQLGSELTALVTYDVRMADAARQAGLPVAMPGDGGGH